MVVILALESASGQEFLCTDTLFSKFISEQGAQNWCYRIGIMRHHCRMPWNCSKGLRVILRLFSVRCAWKMVPLRRVPVSKINGRLGLDHGTVIRSILSVKLNLQMFYKEEVLNTQAVDFSFKANVSADKAPTAATRAEQAQSSADSAM